MSSDDACFTGRFAPLWKTIGSAKPMVTTACLMLQNWLSCQGDLMLCHVCCCFRFSFALGSKITAFQWCLSMQVWFRALQDKNLIFAYLWLTEAARTFRVENIAFDVFRPSFCFHPLKAVMKDPRVIGTRFNGGSCRASKMNTPQMKR